MRGADQLQPGHLEHSESIEPPEPKMTVAEYILFKFYSLGGTAFHTIRGLESTPLVSTSFRQNLVEPLFWNTIQEAVWASQSLARRQGFGAVFGPESMVCELFEGIVSSAYQLLPLVYVIQRSLRIESKELCGLSLSIHEKGRKELRGLIRKFSAAYFLLDDRRTAAARIDKAIDASLELLQPVVIELPDEVAQSYIPAHTYRKTVFNYEDQDLIKSCWQTILSRLEQAQSPLFILGHECWPPLWHHTLLILGGQFEVETVASPELFGHLGTYQPEHFQGYFQLLSLGIDLQEIFDSIFVFGVPSDNSWLEMISTHHDLALGETKEFFTINSCGVSFGDGREFMPSPCLKEFFYQAPLITAKEDIIRLLPAASSIPAWYAAAASLKGLHAPLFVPNDQQIISTLIKAPPFAQIFIQPDNADESWMSVAISAWAHDYPSQVILAAGNFESLFRIPDAHLHRFIRNNLILLVHGSESSTEEAASLLGAVILTTCFDLEHWLTDPRTPGIIWIDSDESEKE
jgi:hypothetical protein